MAPCRPRGVVSVGQWSHATMPMAFMSSEAIPQASAAPRQPFVWSQVAKAAWVISGSTTARLAASD